MKPWLAAVAFCFIASPAAAWGQACVQLAMIDEVSLRDSLKSLSDDVLGKPALAWGEADFDGLLATAKYCHNYSNGTRTIRFGSWQSMLNQARETVLPISKRLHETERAVSQLTLSKGKLPNCVKAIEFSFKSDDGFDNSAALFGQDLAESTPADIDTMISYIQICGEYLPHVAALKLSVDEKSITSFLQQTVERMHSVRDRIVNRGARQPRDSDLKALHDGRAIPVILLSEATYRLVSEVNDIRAGVKRSNNRDISRLTSEAWRIATDPDTSAIDREYAGVAEQAMKDLIFN